MTTRKVVFLDRQSLKARVRTPAGFEYVEHDKTSPEQVVERLKDATVAITNKIPLRAEALKDAKRQLATLAKRRVRPHVPVRHYVLKGVAYSVIVEAASKAKADLIVNSR